MVRSLCVMAELLVILCIYLYRATLC